MYTRRFVLAIAIGLGTDTQAAPADEPRADAQQPEQLDVQLPLRIRYQLSLPKGYDQQDQWPLLVFLHGSGERGDDVELVKVHGPPMLIAEGREFPFIVVSPQCPQFQAWHAPGIAALIDDVVRRYKVDEDRVYLTGLSLGASGTWSLAAQKPDRFAAIVPICGTGDPAMAEVLKDTPIWVFHGARDDAVPIKRSADMVAALNKAGGNVRFTIYPEAAHDAWTETYANPELYQWLLQQRRK
jgi:predicted peptidase